MSERCLTLGCPEVLRVAEVESCSGLPLRGETKGYAISCIRNWSIEPIVREGEVSEFPSDCGNVVARDKQDDQLLGYTISFETSVRSTELEALLTGKELITDGGNHIGTYGVASSVGCSTDSADPHFTIEAFYKLSVCTEGANHVRVVLPMAQFKVTELDREGSITFFRYSATTSMAQAGSFGEGPFVDFPEDVSDFLGERGDEYTTGFDFEENIEVSGSCGSILIPAITPLVYDPLTDRLTINSDDPDFSAVTEIDLTTAAGVTTILNSDAGRLIRNSNYVTILGAAFSTNGATAGQNVTAITVKNASGTIWTWTGTQAMLPNTHGRVTSNSCVDVCYDLDVDSDGHNYQGLGGFVLPFIASTTGYPAGAPYDAQADLVTGPVGGVNNISLDDGGGCAGLPLTPKLRGLEVRNSLGVLVDSFGIANANQPAICPP